MATLIFWSMWAGFGILNYIGIKMMHYFVHRITAWEPNKKMIWTRMHAVIWLGIGLLFGMIGTPFIVVMLALCIIAFGLTIAGEANPDNDSWWHKRTKL